MILDREGIALRRARDDDRRPDLFDRVEAALFFAVWTQDAVRGRVAHGIYPASLVRADNVLVHERPDEAAGGSLAGHHDLPVVLKARAGTAVVKTVKKFRGEERLVAGSPPHDIVIRRVMFGINAAEGLPRMQHVALLWIPFGEFAVQRGVPPALVAVVPK